MSATEPDVIDTLVGIEPGSHLDTLRAHRPEVRTHAQTSYLTLFALEVPGDFTARERFAVAYFVIGLHGQGTIGAFYASSLDASAGLRRAIDAEIAAATTRGPYGAYPPGPLSVEDTAGPIHRVDDANRAALGPRLTAAFEHVHMLVFHPRDAAAKDLEALLDAGWSTTEIVTLSQIFAFVAFQSRVVAGLRTLAAMA